MSQSLTDRALAALKEAEQRQNEAIAKNDAYALSRARENLLSKLGTVLKADLSLTANVEAVQSRFTGNKYEPEPYAWLTWEDLIIVTTRVGHNTELALGKPCEVCDVHAVTTSFDSLIGLGNLLSRPLEFFARCHCAEQSEAEEAATEPEPTWYEQCVAEAELCLQDADRRDMASTWALLAVADAIRSIR